jgi:hypothetical protein
VDIKNTIGVEERRGKERRGELYHKMSIDSCSDY